MYLGKRILDLSIAILILPFAVNLILFSGLFLFLSSGKSPLFFQKRPGYQERLFTIYKLRTLFPDYEKTSVCNRLGRILRRFSIDELPQLFNVLKGQMSLVGPRPLLTEYLPLYNDEQRKRHLVLPGITGWAQIQGRNVLDWHQRFELDLWYIQNQSLRVDIKIILKSAGKIFLTSDVKPEGLSEEEKFKGRVSQEKKD